MQGGRTLGWNKRAREMRWLWKPSWMKEIEMEINGINAGANQHGILFLKNIFLHARG
jgi:hypothetical protein